MRLVAAANDEPVPAVAGEAERAARVQLAAAIEERNAAERVVAEARASVERSKELIGKAETDLETAAAVAARARQGAVAAAVAAASGGTAMQPGSTRASAEARTALAEAGEFLDACRGALVACQAALEEPERELQRAQQKVAAAVDRVIVTATPRMVAAVGVARAEFTAVHASLLYLQGIGHRSGDELDKAIEHALHGEPYGDHTHPAAREWARVRLALASDANAPLPDA